MGKAAQTAVATGTFTVRNIHGFPGQYKPDLSVYPGFESMGVSIDRPSITPDFWLLQRAERLGFQIGVFSTRLSRDTYGSRFHRLMGQRDAVIAAGSRMPSLDLLELIMHAGDGPGVRIPDRMLSLALLNTETVLAAKPPRNPDELIMLLSVIGAAASIGSPQYSDRSSPSPRRTCLSPADDMGRVAASFDETADKAKIFAGVVTADRQQSLLLRLALNLAQIWTVLPATADRPTICSAFITLNLQWEGLPALFVTRAFANNYAGLEDALTSGQEMADWTPWCARFLDVLEVAYGMAKSYLECLEQLSQAWSKELSSVQSYAQSDASTIALSLAFEPVSRTRDIARRLGVSSHRANEIVADLASCGMIRLYGETGQNRGFYAPQVLAALTEGSG